MQKELVTVRILEGCKTCREVNPFGSYVKEQPNGHLDSCNCNVCDKIFNQWQEAESKLRTFIIEYSVFEIQEGYKYEQGLLFNAEIQENGKVIII